jgi:hypothetical protein
MTISADLILIPGTSLYRPADPGAGENMIFLRWDPATPPTSLTFGNTWADSGAPLAPGYFVFLNTTPADSDAPALETLLRKDLAATDATSFIWASFSPGPPTASLEIQTTLALKLNAAKQPSVNGDTIIRTPPGIGVVGFQDGALVIAKTVAGAITGFEITYTPSSSTRSPLAKGVQLPITGGLVGCATFRALIDASDATAAATVKKALVAVSIDPLHPIDSKRNYTLYTGQEFWLTMDGTTRQLRRAS